ncbi:MAG: hypothetical protein C0404_04555 [Verrucomicrobia bacterium]|nr:hypothetical protein [Verrucomicrobiota bacterium]
MVVVVALSVVLSGCGKKASEKMAEKMVESAMAKDGVKGKVDISGDKVTVQTKDGTTTFSGGGNAKIPDNFPKEVYVPDGATITASASTPGGFTLVLQVKDPGDKVAEVYKSKMTGAGWKEESSMNQPGMNMLVYKKAGTTMTAIIAGSDKVTQVSLNVAEDKKAAKATE